MPDIPVTSYPIQLEGDVATDCGLVHVRPIRPEDGPALVEFHDGLSRDSQYLRFFNAHPHLSLAEVARFTQVDYQRRLALVVEQNGGLIAVGRYDMTGATGEAEVAFVVSDAYQRHGLGTMLLGRLAAAAAERGIEYFVAETLAVNRNMLAVFHESGFKTESWFEGGVVRVRFPIEPDTKGSLVRQDCPREPR